MNEPGLSDEILSRAEEYIKELLKNKHISQPVRAQLEIQSYFLMFLVRDHERLNQIYPFYLEQKQIREKWEKWLDRFQWVLIPIIITGVIGFLGQFIYFWLVIVPKLTTLK
jgi:hypothetical protein